MLGGTQTAHAGNCSRCRPLKPPHAAMAAPTAFHLRVQQRPNEQNQTFVCVCSIGFSVSWHWAHEWSEWVPFRTFSINFGFQKEAQYVLPVSPQLVRPVTLVLPNSDGEGVTLAPCRIAQRLNRGRVSCHPRQSDRQNISRKEHAWTVWVLLEIKHQDVFSM